MILNEQQAMIRDTARRFAREQLKPNSARWIAKGFFHARP
jgi:Acyl-CoA dehydrogenase, N-terminal domain